jgi:hypothetical protein
VQRLGIPNGLVLVDGQLAGSWRRTTTATQVAVDVVQLREFSAPEREALERHAAEYGAFLGLEPGVVVRAT